MLRCENDLITRLILVGWQHRRRRTRLRWRMRHTSQWTVQHSGLPHLAGGCDGCRGDSNGLYHRVPPSLIRRDESRTLVRTLRTLVHGLPPGRPPEAAHLDVSIWYSRDGRSTTTPVRLHASVRLLRLGEPSLFLFSDDTADQWRGGAESRRRVVRGTIRRASSDSRGDDQNKDFLIEAPWHWEV